MTRAEFVARIRARGLPDYYASKVVGELPPLSRTAAETLFGWDPAKYLIPGTCDVKPEWPMMMKRITFPEPLHFANFTIKSALVHTVCADAAASALAEVHAAGYWKELDPYGGSYNFRLTRESTILSPHAFACAFDFATTKNMMKVPIEQTSLGKLPGLVRIFEEWGFYWGGRWTHRPDAMHFQFGAGW